ncbi:MAG: TonB-dependent receptor plug domain-containing protein, partial [Flavobacteriales bacterium]|nr:TonB-dependent receptor plug domain-containing protein [Flavobacteriales bacterium]
MKHFTLPLFFLLTSLTAFAQSGQLSGVITDSADGMGIPGANVYLKETLQGTSTDLDGNYTIQGIAPGTYTLVCSFISYEDQFKEGLLIESGQVTQVDVAMGEQVNLIAGAEVIVKENRATVFAIDRIKSKAAVPMDGISSASIKENGDSDVASAAKRVTGVSVEGGKYVYVRGLSDRYSKTTLNGAEIPGLDPNRNSVQLDLFPSSLIQNMMITKAFTPDLPGSFTGGLINIETKDFPEEFEQNLSISLGYNTQATFNSDFITYEGGNTDWLGFDDGSRSLPSEIQGAKIPGVEDGMGEELTNMSQSFSKVWDYQEKAALPNMAFSYSIGNQKRFEESQRTLGYNAAITYNRSNSYYSNGNTSRYLLTGTTESAE